MSPRGVPGAASYRVPFRIKIETCAHRLPSLICVKCASSIKVVAALILKILGSFKVETSSSETPTWPRTIIHATGKAIEYANSSAETGLCPASRVAL